MNEEKACYGRLVEDGELLCACYRPEGRRHVCGFTVEAPGQQRVVVWWKGRRYEGTWTELYPIIRRDVDICADCRCEYLGLERVGPKLICADCRKRSAPLPAPAAEQEE